MLQKHNWNMFSIWLNDSLKKILIILINNVNNSI